MRWNTVATPWVMRLTSSTSGAGAAGSATWPSQVRRPRSTRGSVTGTTLWSNWLRACQATVVPGWNP